jgi:hypothetical protein
MSAISQFIPNQDLTAATILADAASIAELAMYALASNYDEVQIYDDFYNQLFSNARIMKSNVNLQSKLMDHPVEDGSLTTDFRVILPVEIELSVIVAGLDYRSTYKKICAWYLAGWTLNVATRVQTYTNMMIQAIPRDEMPEMYDVCVMQIKLREVMIIKTQYQSLSSGQVQNTNDQSTVSSGQQSAAPGPTGSIASKLLNFVKGVF